MHIELDPVLLEEVVFLAIRHREQLGDQSIVEQYHHRVDALYDLPHDGDAREIAFRDVHAEFFSQLGLERMIRGPLAEFPLLEEKLERVTFLKAAARKQEGAELFVREDDETGGRQNRVAVVRLRAELFLDPDRLSRLLRHELYHVSDMVDPAFGYRPDLGETGETIAQQNLVRDRYRVLWSIYIDARLVRTDRAPATALNDQERLLARAFDGFGDGDTRAIFETVSDATSLTHADLLALAKSGTANTVAGGVEASLGSCAPRLSTKSSPTEVKA